MNNFEAWKATLTLQEMFDILLDLAEPCDNCPAADCGSPRNRCRESFFAWGERGTREERWVKMADGRPNGTWPVLMKFNGYARIGMVRGDKIYLQVDEYEKEGRELDAVESWIPFGVIGRGKDDKAEIGDAELMREGLSLLDEFDLTTCKAVDVAKFRSRLSDFVLNVARYAGGKEVKKDDNP